MFTDSRSMFARPDDEAAEPDHNAPMAPTPAEREQMIAVAAYFLAEHRGFAPGRATDDWFAAERQIDAMLAAMRRRGVTRRQFERAGLRNALSLYAGEDAARVGDPDDPDDLGVAL